MMGLAWGRRNTQPSGSRDRCRGGRSSCRHLMAGDGVRAGRQPLLGVAQAFLVPGDRGVGAQLAADLAIDAVAAAAPVPPADELERLLALFAVFGDDDLHAKALATRKMPSQSHAEMMQASIIAAPPGSGWTG